MEVNAQSVKDIAGKESTWCSSAIINSVVIDKDEVLCKVTLQPTGETPLVRYSSSYAGNGFGLYILPAEKQEVLVVFPNGDLNRGIIIHQLNNGVDILPEGVTQDEILLIGAEGKHVNINIKGNVKLNVKGDVEVVANTIKVTTGGS